MQRGRVLQCQGIVIAMLCMFGRLEPAWGAVVVNFEDLALAPESYCNGSDGAGGFTSGEAFFNNSFTDFGGGFFAWSGWSYSNVTDNSTPGFDNQYSAIAGSGANGSSNYAVGFPGTPDGTTIELPQSMFP